MAAVTATRRRTRTTPGSYLTDGRHLVQVRHLLEGEEMLVVEDGPVDFPNIHAIPMQEVRRRWRLVTPERDPDA